MSFFLIALPAIAAYAFGPAAVAAFTALAILLEGSLAATAHHLGETHHVTADIATAVVGILATALAAHRRSQERHLVHANSVAEALMRALLRPVPHQVGNVLAACLYRPSEAGTMVGGDLFDIRATRAGNAPSSATYAAKDSRRSAPSQPSSAASATPPTRRTTCRPSPPAWNGGWSASRGDPGRRTVRDRRAHRVRQPGAPGDGGQPRHVEPVLISRGRVRTLDGPPALPLGLGRLAAPHAPDGQDRPDGPDGRWRAPTPSPGATYCCWSRTAGGGP
ncbi:hypothetical protein JYK04_08224 [Streptomyces nojiriensis]|nr:hypothetical protein JYK04_08224 [Streptomyces nojiriensis]